MINFITESTEYLQDKGFDNPEVGIILGTGLGQLIDHIDILAVASYNHIPNFPTATVEFHKGKLIYGILEGKKSCGDARSLSCLRRLHLTRRHISRTNYGKIRHQNLVSF